MAILKKNIWLLFYILLLFSILLLSTISYLSWKNIYTEHQIEQENIVNLIANSTHSLFRSQETILNIVGNRFAEDNNYKDNPKAMTTLNATLLDNPSMDAIALATPEGKMTFSSGGYDVSEFPNLLEQEVSKNSFLATLKSHKMVFGRTYYFKPIKQWIVPIRKAIRNEQGDIITVITAALRMKDSFGNFDKNLGTHHEKIISIVRDEDFYTQYMSSSEKDNMVYLNPITREERETIRQAIFDTHSITISEFRENEYLISFIYKGTNGIKYLSSLQYDKTYKLWIGVRLPFEIIIQEFLKSLIIYISIFALLCIIFFFLFRIIARAENKRHVDLVFQATHDQLTGLPNRTYLQQNIGNWLYKNASPFSILYVDMDNFKNINDSFGHECGDYLLVALAKRLQAIIPKNSIIIRYGGDEFVIFTHLNQDDVLLELAKNIIETISKPYDINTLNLNVGASIGIAKYSEHGDSLNMLLRAADIAMYESKKTKNTAHIFEDAMQEGYLQNVRIEQELHKAIDQNELFMVYQPQIDREGNIHGVEALARWNSATLGIIPPFQFIPVAELSGQMAKIGRFIIGRTLEEIRAVQETLGISFQTSINISIRQFMEIGFLEHFLKTIHDTQMSEISITIEVTENLFIEDIDYILPLLHEIRNFGIKISMDDFGTGYSSLSMLRQLPIDELKIDKSFIDTIFEDETTQKMVQNIIAIGKNFNMHVLAEGVETKEQKDILTSLGCDRFQGYYFARPLPKDELIAFFKKGL